MFGERIKELRLSLGLNQVEFGKSLNVTKQSVSNWENENIQPSIDMLTKIAKLYSVSADYLLGRDDVTVRLVGDDALTMLDYFNTDEMQAGQLKKIIDYFFKMNETGRVEALNRLQEMTSLEKYTKK